jgi:hypothetical protein
MRLWTIGAVLILATGCAGGATGARAPLPSVTASAGIATAPGVSGSPSPSPVTTGVACHGTPLLSGAGFPEVRGTARDAELWGLLFSPVPFERKKEIKIVWRMTGEGPLKAVATLPDGTRAKLAWGPEEHGGSTWNRPGAEWGTGFAFPKAGCWKIELSRTRGSGTVWLPVK